MLIIHFLESLVNIARISRRFMEDTLQQKKKEVLLISAYFMLIQIINPNKLF